MSKTPSTQPTDGDIRKPLRQMQIAAFAAVVVIAGVLYAFNHGSDSVTPAADLGTTTFPVITVSNTYRQKLPQFEWSNGTTKLNTADLTGGWTLVSFWAISCAPCMEEMPDLDEFHEDWSGPPLKIVTINVDPGDPESLDAIQSFLTENDVQLSVYYDPKGELKKIFDVTEIPRHFLINPKGEILWNAKGAFQWTAPESQKALLTLMEKEKSEPNSQR